MVAKILVIDDEPELTGRTLDELKGDVEVVHPSEVTIDHLREAHVALVDHNLNAGNWPEREDYPIAVRPVDGIALAGILLGHLRKIQSDGKHFPPTAVALLSNQLGSITPGLTDPPEHLAARASGLHWAFGKSTLDGTLVKRVRVLAAAVERMPQRWPENDSDKLNEELSKLLGLDSSKPWALSALEHVFRCHPPVHELADWSSGLSFIRWWAQMILPYPACLIDTKSLAMRLGVTPHWLQESLSPDGGVQKALKPAKYTGLLADFLGPRWWAAGVDAVLWDAIADDSTSRTSVRELLTKLGGTAPKPMADDRTLVLGDKLILLDEAVAVADCVRVRPDDWPVYADQPWTSVTLAKKHPRLAALVAPEDAERVASA